MSLFRLNANLVVEVGVDDEEHDDEFKGFQEWLEGISLCCLWVFL